MKSLILFVVFFFEIFFSYSSPKIINGVLNDVSPDEMKLLYACKNNINEAYSDGCLFMYDKNTRKSSKIIDIKNLDYSVKSYFINNDTVLVSLTDKIVLYSLKSKRVLKNVYQSNDKSFLISTINKINGVYFTIMNYRNSTLSLKRIDLLKNSIESVTSITVQELPTDNFFDIYSIGERCILFDNGNLKDLHNNNVILNSLRLYFNDLQGKYVISSVENTLCYIVEKSNMLSVFVVSKDNIKKVSVKISNNINEQVCLETSIQDGEGGYLLTAGKENFFIKINGTVKVMKMPLQYSSKKMFIVKRGMSMFELK